MPLPPAIQAARRSLSLPVFVLWILALPAAAQYPGHTQKNQQAKVVAPRATGVLEWTGEAGKPKASRIVPVTVFIDGEYQDGGLYLAQPAPMAVEADTVYELQQAGVPKGSYDLAGGERVGDVWFGFGDWKPLAAPKPVKKLPASKNPAQMVQDHDPDRPHFKGSGDAKASGGTSGDTAPGKPADTKISPPPPASAPIDDPDKPTLHRRADAGSGDNTQTSGAGTAPEDPDRPHLKKRSDAPAKTTSASGDPTPVTSANEADPDRPKLSRGKPTLSVKEMEATKLSGMPADLQQMAAVSDPATREEHPFLYQWANPDDAVKMQTALEGLATKAVLANGAAPAPQIPPPAAKRPRVPGSTGATGRARSNLARPVPMRPLPVVLTDKDFHAYELSYSGGATLVFSAKALVGPNNAGVTLEKYVTLIAQPDFDSNPQLRLQSVTDAAHFDITPRMRLVDAVDTDGDNRAELVFELRHATDRQFAIYKVRGLRAEQAFATGSLPYGSPIHVEAKTN